MLLLSLIPFSEAPKCALPVVFVDTGEIAPENPVNLIVGGKWSPVNDPTAKWKLDEVEGIDFAFKETTMNFDLLEARKRGAQHLIRLATSGKSTFRLSDIPKEIREQFQAILPGITDRPSADPVFKIDAQIDFELTNGTRKSKLRWAPYKDPNPESFANDPKPSGWAP